MAIMEAGRICIKTTGKEAGKKIVVIKTEGKENKAVIEGIGIKRKNCNIRHLFPTKEKINITEKTSKEEILKALKG
jgi:large subunit ribosomal protein L14e